MDKNKIKNEIRIFLVKKDLLIKKGMISNSFGATEVANLINHLYYKELIRFKAIVKPGGVGIIFFIENKDKHLKGKFFPETFKFVGEILGCISYIEKRI